MSSLMSVFPKWMSSLSLQQQSVLVLALRGPDGIEKFHPCKRIVRAYRGTVLTAAKYGRMLHFGEKADTFMSLDDFGQDHLWLEASAEYFNGIDALPHHYHMHLMHGAQVLGYKHPNPVFRSRWLNFYLRCVDDAHLLPEDEEAMDRRLGDWDRKYWSHIVSKEDEDA